MFTPVLLYALSAPCFKVRDQFQLWCMGSVCTVTEFQTKSIELNSVYAWHLLIKVGLILWPSQAVSGWHLEMGSSRSGCGWLERFWEGTEDESHLSFGKTNVWIVHLKIQSMSPRLCQRETREEKVKMLFNTYSLYATPLDMLHSTSYICQKRKLCFLLNTWTSYTVVPAYCTKPKTNSKQVT